LRGNTSYDVSIVKMGPVRARRENEAKEERSTKKAKRDKSRVC